MPRRTIESKTIRPLDVPTSASNIIMKGLLTKVVTRLTPSCQEMSHLSSQSLDRKLTLKERIGVRLHGWICSWCIDYSDQVHKVSNTVHNKAESLAELKEDCLTEDCKKRMRDMMEAAAKENVEKP